MQKEFSSRGEHLTRVSVSVTVLADAVVVVVIKSEM